MTRMFGPWTERLEAVAASRELVAVGGRRDAVGVVETRVHVFPPVLDKPGVSWSLPSSCAVYALAFAGEELLLVGGDDGTIAAWDVTGNKRVGDVAVGGPIRALAIDAGVARGDRGTIAVGTADGAVVLVAFAIESGTPRFTVGTRHALSDGAIHAVAFDPAGLWLAGGSDGQLSIIGTDVRKLAPGGEGGIRAIASIGDGRALIGCGDGTIRACYVVGAVEPTDRSGDHGHDGAIRGLALGPVILDDAGREQPRRFFTVGDDRALKIWFVDGARRPRTLETVVGSPATAIVFAPGPVAKVDKAAGRLWITGTQRTVAMLVLGPDAEPTADKPVELESAIAGYHDLLADTQTATSRSAAGVKVKLDTIAALERLAEDVAREQLDFALTSTQPTEVLVAAARAIARSNRRASRPAVRGRLAHDNAEVRAAAFVALKELEGETPITAIKAGLATSHDDIRIAALDALVPLAPTSAVARGLVTDMLRDRSHAVRRHAFTVLRRVLDRTAAVKVALAHAVPDIRGEALLYLAFVIRSTDAAARQLTLSAFDDADPGVRTSAFLAAIFQQPALAARLVKGAPSVAAAFQQVQVQLAIAVAQAPDSGAPLDDSALEPLFVALACRNADAANRGAGGLLAIDDPRAIGAVLQLTREADPILRRGATKNLVAALARWPSDDRLAARLVWLLDDLDAEVRAYAFGALAEAAAAAGPTAELELAETAMRTSQEDIRVRALQVLVRVGAPGSALATPADALLGDALDDEAPKVRTEAFRTLWAWHSGDPMVPLARGRASRHGDLRQQVVNEIDRRRSAKQATAEMDQLVHALVGDPVAAVGLAAFTALTRQPDPAKEVAIDPAVVVAAMSSPAPAVRAAGAAAAAKAPANAVRARLVELVKDEHPSVHTAAIESLDAVAPTDGEGFALAFASVFWNLQVRACELLGQRRDKRAVAPTTRILSIPKTDINRPPDEIRRRAATALAMVGDLDSLRFLVGLVDGDDDGFVKEQGARGIATAAVRGHDAAGKALVALLGHENLAVRSWGGEGLAKLGDLRALPVLAGTQRHEHRPIRVGAIVGFVALGPDGVRGLRQGLEDRDREIQDLAFAVIVARDVALAAAGIAPDLLVDAMSSPSPEIRFAAARLFERRVAGETAGSDDLGELVGPRKPVKETDAKDWPAIPRRAALLAVLADAIASDDSQQRYAATQVLALRGQPLAFWREAARLAGPSGRAAPVPHTGYATDARVARKAGWLRRLVGDKRDAEASELENLARIFVRVGKPVDVDQAAAQRLVFGVYAGLVRQAPAPGEADETHRVRRDAVGRLVELAREDAVGADAVLPVLGHAVGDPHHLVRQAAMAALRSLYPIGALAPLQMAIGGAADLGKAAIDELVELALEGDDRAAALVRSALDADDPQVRAHAAQRLPKLYAAGSVEPQLLAAQSRHGDVRLAAVSELAGKKDTSGAVTEALIGALGSEHDDLKLAAAKGLAKLGNPLGIEVLGAFLRNDDHQWDAMQALQELARKPEAGAAAAEAIAGRLDNDPDRDADRDELLEALGTIGHIAGAPSIVRLLVAVEPGKERDLEDDLDNALGAMQKILVDRTRKPRQLPDGRERDAFRDEHALQFLGELARSPLPVVRTKVAAMLGDVDDRGAEDVLAKLLGDRVVEVRVAAAEALALRAEYVPNATLAALEAALRGGRRELVLPAAMGLAARKRPEAFQPLLLVAKAGEPAEQERALIAVGALGDKRALEHLVPMLDPAPDDELARQLMPAAVEALGRLLPALTGDEANDYTERVERFALAGTEKVRLRALTGLRYGAGDRGRAILERVAGDVEEDGTIRAHAVEQLGLLADPHSEALLAELMSDEDYEVTEAANPALLKVVGRDQTRFSLHALVATNEDASQKAARFLAQKGDAALLVDKLGSVKNAEVRKMLREGLIRRGEVPKAAIEAALRGDAAAPRAEAAWITAAKPDAGIASDALIAAVDRSAAELADLTKRGASIDDARREVTVDAYRAALWAVRRAHQAKGVEHAAKAALADTSLDGRIRREATRVLVDTGNTATLAGAMEDIDPEIRLLATRATAGASDVAARVKAIGSRADAVTIAPAAIAAWKQIGSALIAEPATRSWALAVSVAGKTIDELVAIARGKGEAPERLDAIAALGLIGGDAALAVLEAIHKTDAEPDDIKRAAWKAIKRIVNARVRTFAAGQDKGKSTQKPAADGDGDGDDDAPAEAASDDGDDDDGDDDDGSDDDDDDDDDDDGDDEDDE